MFRHPFMPAVLAALVIAAPAASSAHSTPSSAAQVAAPTSTAISLRGGSDPSASAVIGAMVRQAPDDVVTLTGAVDGLVMAADGVSVHLSPPAGRVLAEGTSYPLAAKPGIAAAAYVEIETAGRSLTGEAPLGYRPSWTPRWPSPAPRRSPSGP